MNKKCIIRIMGCERTVIFENLTVEEANWLRNELNYYKPGYYHVINDEEKEKLEKGTLYDVEEEIFSRFQEMFRESEAVVCEDMINF